MKQPSGEVIFKTPDHRIRGRGLLQHVQRGEDAQVM